MKITVSRKYDAASQHTKHFTTANAHYFHSHLYGIAKCKRINCNSAAHQLTRMTPNEHIIPTLHNLLWLPIESRMIFKILLVASKILHGLSSVHPKYTKILSAVESFLFFLPPAQDPQNRDSFLQTPGISLCCSYV